MKVLLISCALLVFTRTATDGAGNGTIQLFVNSIQQCLGHPVTLTCHHLVPRPRGDRYIPDDYFEVNHQNKGTTIISSREENVHFTANATTTTMTLTLCEEYNGNWSCFMTNRGHEFRSNNVTINALEVPIPPEFTAVDSHSSKTRIMWAHDTVCFNASKIEYIVEWMSVAQGSGNATTVNKTYTIPTGVSGEYRIWITAVVSGMIASKDSRSELHVHAGLPIVEGAKSSPCIGQPFYLSCLHPYATNYNITWTSNGSPIKTSDVKYTVYGEQLEIKNVTKDVFSNGPNAYKCIVQYNGVMVSGRPYFLHPIDRPVPPDVAIVDTTYDAIILTLDHSLVCYEDHTFHYKISWRREDGEWSDPVVATSKLSYTITGLHPATEYRVRVLVVSVEDPTVVSEPLTVRAVTLAGPVMALTAGFGMTTVTLLTTTAILVVLCIYLLRKLRKHKAKEPADPEIEDAVCMTSNPCYITIRQSSGSS